MAIAIYNEGCTCFLNAVIQSLSYIPIVVEKLTSIHKKEHSKFDDMILKKINFKEHQKYGVFSVETELIQNVYGVGIGLQGQQDPAGFLQVCMESSGVISNLLKWNEVEKMKCSSCSCVLRKCINEDNYILMLKFDSENKEKNIRDLIVTNTKGKHIEGYKCEAHATVDGTSCLCVKSAFQVHYPKTFPDILCVSLPSRIYYDNTRRESRKDNRHFDPQKELYLPDVFDKSQKKMKMIRYILISTIVHHGMYSNKGHYTSYVRIGERWYHIDDEIIVEVNSNTARFPPSSQNIYMMFYERIFF